MRWNTTLIGTLAAGLLVSLLTCAPPDVRLGVGDGDGVRLAYRVVGKGPPLVVIHDGPGLDKSLMFRGFDFLRSDMKVVYYDQRGCGKSERLTPSHSLRIEDNVADLEALRRYLNIRRFSIAAHGWGAVIALEYARTYADNVDAIMLVTPISPFAPQVQLESTVDRLPGDAKDAITSAINDATSSMLEKREAVMRAVLPALFHRKDAKSRVDFDAVRASPEVNIRLSEELKSFDLFSVLPKVSQPTLVIVGRRDISISVRDQMAYADGMEQASAVVFNRSGHFPFLEEPRFFSRITKEFFLERRVPALVNAIGIQ